VVAQLQADIAELEIARDRCTTEAATAEDRVACLNARRMYPVASASPLIQKRCRVGCTDNEVRRMRVVAAMTEVTL
jgi:hypothetical protein